MSFIKIFSTLSASDVMIAGGKGSSLGEMTQAGMPVPPGFVVLADAFERFMDANSLRSEIDIILRELDHNAISSIESASEKIQELILNGEIPKEIEQEIVTYQKKLGARFCAVRSSATAEDGIEHAWAGQLNTYLNVPKDEIEQKIQSCWASLFTPRALFYRSEKGLRDTHISVAVVVQEMVDAECAGVAFSVHPVTENHDEIVIEGSWGLGEAVVSGEVTPDSFVVSKSSGEILSQHIAEKKRGIFRNKEGLNEWVQINTEKCEQPILSNEKIEQLSQLIIKIENHYGFPCDIEWAFVDNELYILQARPITTLSIENKKVIQEGAHLIPIKGSEEYLLRDKAEYVKIVKRPYPPLLMSLVSLGQSESSYFKHFISEWTSLHQMVTVDSADVYYVKKEMDQIGRHMFDSFQDEEVFIKSVQRFEEQEKRLLNSIHGSFEDFILEYQKYTPALQVPMMQNYLQEYLERKLSENIGVEKTAEIMNVLNTPLRDNQYKLEMFELSEADDIVAHVKKYEYLGARYGTRLGYTVEKALEKKKNLNLNAMRQADLQEKKKIHKYISLAKNALVPDEKHMIDVMQWMIYYRTQRTDVLNQASFLAYELFVTKAKELGLTYDELLYCTRDEILKKNIPEKNILSARSEGYSMINLDIDIRVFTRDQNQYFIQYFSENYESILEITGQSTSKGSVKGIVRVIHTIHDLGKLQKGEILVTSMTTPDMIFAMGQAIAFVTDEGGITCHAAIMSRELKKPCIIGTKNATKVLKDGDFVEVDADRGIVKILENNGEPNFSEKSLEVWIERKQSIFSMTVFHELESEVMRKHLGAGFQTQICFMKDKNCSYIHEVGDLENVINAIAKKLENTSKEEVDDLINDMNFWEEIGKKILQEGVEKVIISNVTKKKYLEDYKKIGYWTTVVPYFLLEAIHAIRDTKKYQVLNRVCEKLRSDSLYPILNEKITHKILEDISESIGLENGDWYYITWAETLNILDGNISKNTELISKRKDRDNAFWRKQNGEIFFLGDVKNLEFLKSVAYPVSTSSVIKGTMAYPGKIQGKVKILRSTADMRDFGEGDILVSPNSNPSLIQCIKKCGAIVTDEGGVSCHAAIISRELKKPCIIGTKIATKMLKDGDLVEVDADSGTVKVVKRKDVHWAFTYDRQMSYQRIDLFHYGYCVRLSRYFDVTIENELYRIKNGTVSVFYDKYGHAEAFKKIRLLLTGEDAKKWYQKIYTTITADYAKFIEFLDAGENNIKDQNLELQLQECMKQNRDISLATWLLYSYIEEILTDVLQESLQKKGLKNWKEIFEILSQPDEMIPSDSWEYDTADTCLGNLEERKQKTEKIYRKYQSYGMYDVMFLGQDTNAIDETIVQQRDIAENIVSKIQQKYLAQKEALKKIQDIAWDKTEQELIQLYRLYANFKDWKNFHRERSSYQIKNLYEKIAKKFMREVGELYYMNVEEILLGIRENQWLGEQEIKQRKTNSALVFRGIEENNISDEEELFILDTILSPQKDILSGTVAYPGKVSGRARIINSHEDIKKLEKGEIMISSTTRPDYLPFMTHIAGFVTNEGGVLSHAAILAREVKKPCIIGTKIATQVLKDGDLVEVDAKNGVVKILEQKKGDYFDNNKLLSEGGRACYLYPNRIFCTRMNIPHHLWGNHLMVISTSENHKVNWYFAVEDESQFDYTLERVLKQKNMLQEGEIEINELVEKAKNTFKKEYKNTQEAWEGYQNFIRIYEDIGIVPTFLRQLDRATVRALKKAGILEEDFAVATYPTKRTYQRQEEVLLLKLRLQFEEKITPNIEAQLSLIYEDYCTSSLGYFEEGIKTKMEYRERLLGLSHIEAKQDLQKILTEETGMYQQKNALKKSHKETAEIIDTAGFLVYLKDHYKFQINKVQYYAEGLWESISTLTGYNQKFLYDFTPEEMQSLLLGNEIDEESIRKRIECHTYTYNENGEPQLIVGEEARLFLQKYLSTDNKQKSFSGRIACKGKGIGRARVILGTRDFHKMEQGDILVVMNTSPDFVPIMKKAAAIVAEEGGITGHVSVVSREFNIPSVVGIKQITSIIQDGEMIEVDAEKGIVKRLN